MGSSEQLLLLGGMRPVPRLDRGVLVTPEIGTLLAANAPVAMGVSGGKDSCLLGFAVAEYLDRLGHTGPRILIHADLGRVEWRDSAPTCRRLADRLGLELVTVRREAGDMMDRWLVRWSNNVERYANLECVKLILPWSTAAMRFCTSELKTAVICRELVKRWPGRTIVSATGIRRQESSNRAKAPVAKPQNKLTSRTHGTSGYDWNPVLDWTLDEVMALLAARGFPLHEAYTRFGSSRVSCAFCILGSQADLAASASCPDNAAVYREMVDLEITSTFAFQANGWLGDVAPHLLGEEARAGLARAKEAARRREQIEARIPEHLLYVEGWPTIMPTHDEARMLCEVRAEVAALLGIAVRYTDPAALLTRYEELMSLSAARRAGKGVVA